MKTTYRFVGSTEPCGYLPDQQARLEYEHVASLSPEEYSQRLLDGWRRFGHTLFRPRCPSCSACQSLRVEVGGFRPSRSQRRVSGANEGVVRLSIGAPELTPEKLGLYHRFHAYRSITRGWSWHVEDPVSYHETFVVNPFATEEWLYALDGRLVGVGYVDALPVGLSAIYFSYEPAQKARGLGTWNVLCLIEEARRRGLPHVYLGYHVADCVSLAYKARFRPFELLEREQTWRAIADGARAAQV